MPLAVTEKLAVLLMTLVRLCGWLLIEEGTQTVKVAGALVMALTALLMTTL